MLLTFHVKKIKGYGTSSCNAKFHWIWFKMMEPMRKQVHGRNMCHSKGECIKGLGVWEQLGASDTLFSGTTQVCFCRQLLTQQSNMFYLPASWSFQLNTVVSIHSLPEVGHTCFCWCICIRFNQALARRSRGVPCCLWSQVDELCAINE